MKEGFFMEKIKYYSINMLISFGISIVFLLITSLIFAYTSINDRYLNMFVFGIIAISVLVGSMLLLKKIKQKGFLYGILFGIIYCLILYFFTVIAYNGFFFTNTLGIYFLICALTGTVGGIVGVNL